MFYFAHEVRYTRMNYYNRIIDTTISAEPNVLSKAENKVEYSIMGGNRIIRDSRNEGFTMDIFIGIGLGYRDTHNSWEGHGEYDKKYFNGVNNHFYAIPFRFGVNIGYVFKNQGRK